MVTASDVLYRAAEILSEKGWTQGWMARDADGLCVFPGQPEAQSFCAAGAISLATSELEASETEFHRARFAAQDETGLPEPAEADKSQIAAFNDDSSTTKEDVVLLLKRAAERAELHPDS